MNIDGKLGDFRSRIQGWEPKSGFKPKDLDFSTEDIIFGRRIAESVRRHNCCRNPEAIVDDIRREAHNERFQSWFISMKMEKLQSLIEFLLYPTPV